MVDLSEQTASNLHESCIVTIHKTQCTARHGEPLGTFYKKIVHFYGSFALKITKEFADIKQKPQLMNLFNASKGLGSAVPFLIFIAIACGELGFHFIGKLYPTSGISCYR